MKQPYCLLLPGIGAIGTGLPYLVSLFGPTEAEVRLWGFVSLCAGVVALVLSVELIDRSGRAARIATGATSLLIAALQTLPIALWWQFHGRGISDGTPSSPFVAHWGFSMPHIALLAASILIAYAALFGREW